MCPDSLTSKNMIPVGLSISDISVLKDKNFPTMEIIIPSQVVLGVTFSDG
jgi:hypothetical protein